MKKLVPAVIAFVVALGAGFLLLRREAPYRARTLEIAPPEAIFLAQLADLRRTVERWPGTALAQLWREPEMQAFFAGPLEQMPALRQAREHLERLHRIGPREAFLAIVGFDGASPRFVAGLNFSGGKSEVAALVAEPWASWRKAWPLGRTEVLRRPQWEIETHAFEGKLLAGSFHAGWYFMGSDLGLLEATLARCSGGSGIGAPAALHRAATALPAELDFFVFAQPDRLLGRLGAFLTGAREPLAAEEAPAGQGSLAWGVKLEGTQIRDTIFIAGTAGSNLPLARSTQALTSPETLLYGAFLLPARLDLPPATAPLLALLTDAPALALAGDAVSWADFTAAFGPECGVMLDWPAAADAPSMSFVLAVRDAGRVAGFVESLTDQTAAGVRWQREEKDGVIHYQAPHDPKTGTAPALALAREFVVLGAQAPAVRAITARLGAGGAEVGQNLAFQTIVAQVSPPTTAFAYVDFRGLFERSYETLRPFLGMSLALSPETGPYFDAARLPSTAAIARHVGPSIYAQAVRDGGIYIESLGTLSFSQTLASLGAVAWTSRAPAFRRSGKSDGQPTSHRSAEAPANPAETGEKSAKAAETSAETRNDDKKSQIPPSHP